LYKITAELFESHLSAITRSRSAQRGHPRDLPAPLDLPDLVLTFDDGGIGALRAADSLERHGFIGHFFVTANYIGTPGFLATRDIRELRARGHVIGSHSCSHPLRMGHCSRRQLLDEWTRSRVIVSELSGEDVRVASVPGGDFTAPVAEAAVEAGFTRLFTSEPTRTVRKLFGLTLLGRFTIYRSTSASAAAALAAGASYACARQALVWSAKKLLKRVGGEHYLKLRNLLLGHEAAVRWGDMP
jgi:peptidoglycan/xylan/chitin deacetylase (PgdA/CDA1 family)